MTCKTSGWNALQSISAGLHPAFIVLHIDSAVLHIDSVVLRVGSAALHVDSVMLQAVFAVLDSVSISLRIAFVLLHTAFVRLQAVSVDLQIDFAFRGLILFSLSVSTSLYLSFNASRGTFCWDKVEDASGTSEAGMYTCPIKWNFNKSTLF